jgi:hypothetical protein
MATKIGRPLVGSEPMKARQIRMTDAEWEKCKRLGGGDWVREQLARLTGARVEFEVAKREEQQRRRRPVYVYTHAHDGKVFYVGRGNYGRASNWINRNAAHLAVVEKIGRKNVKVEITECKDELEAARLEYRLIKKHAGPGLCNRVHNYTRGA